MQWRIAVLVAAWIFTPVTARAHPGEGAPCPGGRFLLRDAARLGRGATLAAGVPLDVAPEAVRLGGTCADGVIRLRDGHDATRVRARWRGCQGLGSVVLSGRIATPDCVVLQGTIRLAGGRRHHVTAIRSTCGDGVHDADREACEGALGCPATSHCTDACVCEPDTGHEPPSTTTTLAPGATTTTTSTTSTTTTTLLPPVCTEEHPPYEGRYHFAEGRTVTYVHNPPASGPHWPVWLRWERYTTPMRREYWVHNLEHGAIVLLYHPDAPAAVVAGLNAAWDAIPDDAPCDHKRVVMTPDPLLDQDFAVVAQGTVLNCDRPDVARILAFVATYRNHAREQICDQGARP